MKNLSVPLLFFLTIILQIVSCYLFFGNIKNISYLYISIIPSITATFLAYAALYYFMVKTDKERDRSELKFGYTFFYFLIMSAFTLFLFLLVDNTFYSNAIVVNAIILTIYGRQIFNKEIKKLN